MSSQQSSKITLTRASLYSDLQLKIKGTPKTQFIDKTAISDSMKSPVSRKGLCVEITGVQLRA